MMGEARKLRSPEPDPETQPFWDAAKEGRLLLKRCNSCGEAHYYPRSICPICHSADTTWIDAAGTGEIYSLSTTRRGPYAPYTLAYVTLDEGPAILTNIDTDDHDTLKIGQRVALVFAPTDGDIPYPKFTPTGG